MSSVLNLPPRAGTKPSTSNELPHSQLNQHGPDEIVAKLHAYCFSLPGVENAQSAISVPGARALVMHEAHECNSDAFMIGREFAHIHPHPDNGSMHVQVPEPDALEIIRKGWGEDHYLVTRGRLPVGLVLTFSPRDEDELGVIKEIVRRSYAYANDATVHA